METTRGDRCGEEDIRVRETVRKKKLKEEGIIRSGTEDGEYLGGKHIGNQRVVSGRLN